MYCPSYKLGDRDFQYNAERILAPSTGQVFLKYLQFSPEGGGFDPYLPVSRSWNAAIECCYRVANRIAKTNQWEEFPLHRRSQPAREKHVVAKASAKRWFCTEECGIYQNSLFIGEYYLCSVAVEYNLALW